MKVKDLMTTSPTACTLTNRLACRCVRQIQLTAEVDASAPHDNLKRIGHSLRQFDLGELYDNCRTERSFGFTSGGTR